MKVSFPVTHAAAADTRFTKKIAVKHNKIYTIILPIITPQQQTLQVSDLQSQEAIDSRQRQAVLHTPLHLKEVWDTQLEQNSSGK